MHAFEIFLFLNLTIPIVTIHFVLAPKITWYLKDAIIKPSRYFRMLYQDGVARLQINEVFPEDAGTYKCEARNGLGMASCSAQLIVSVEEIQSAAVPPKFVKKIQKVEVTEGHPARFDCKVTGSPRPEIKWYLEGKEIASSPYMRITDSPDGTSSLVIQEVFADDSGRFTVKASNPAGEVTCSTLLVVEGDTKTVVDIEEVTVEKETEDTVEVIMPVEKQPEDVEIEITLIPPEFVEPILSLEVVEGDKAVFEAHVIGSQPIEITWYIPKNFYRTRLSLQLPLMARFAPWRSRRYSLKTLVIIHARHPIQWVLQPV